MKYFLLTHLLTYLLNSTKHPFTTRSLYNSLSCRKGPLDALSVEILAAAQPYKKLHLKKLITYVA